MTPSKCQPLISFSPRRIFPHNNKQINLGKGRERAKDRRLRAGGQLVTVSQPPLSNRIVATVAVYEIKSTPIRPRHGSGVRSLARREVVYGTKRGIRNSEFAILARRNPSEPRFTDTSVPAINREQRGCLIAVITVLKRRSKLSIAAVFSPRACEGSPPFRGTGVARQRDDLFSGAAVEPLGHAL